MLNGSTVRLAEHCEVVCIFVNDNGSRKVLEKLAALGVKLWLCAVPVSIMLI